MPAMRSPVIAQATAASSKRPKISPNRIDIRERGARRRVADSINP